MVVPFFWIGFIRNASHLFVWNGTAFRFLQGEAFSEAGPKRAPASPPAVVVRQLLRRQTSWRRFG